MPLTSTHPERSLLHEYAAWHLSGDERAMIERHLRRCTACRALVNSIPAPTPSADAAVAAADEEPDAESIADAPVALEPITPDIALPVVAQKMSPVRSPGRTRRIVAAALAVVIIILLVASAWYVTTDDFHSRSDGTSSTNASSTSSSSDLSQPV